MRSIKSFFITLCAVLCMVFSPAALADCKGKSSSACSASNTCAWVKAFTRKDGAKVKAHCRTKAGNGVSKKKTKKSSSQNELKSAAEKTSSSKKTSTKKSTAKKTKSEKSSSKSKSSKKSTAKKAKSKKSSSKSKSSKK